MKSFISAADSIKTIISAMVTNFDEIDGAVSESTNGVSETAISTSNLAKNMKNISKAVHKSVESVEQLDCSVQKFKK